MRERTVEASPDLWIVLVMVGALIAGCVVWVAWSLWRVPGEREVMAAMDADPDTRRQWARREGMELAQTRILCERIRALEGPSPVALEKTCRRVLDELCRRQGGHAAWAQAARSSVRIGEMTEEAGQYRIAQEQWRRAAAGAHGATRTVYRQEEEKARAEAERLERENAPTVYVDHT